MIGSREGVGAYSAAPAIWGDVTDTTIEHRGGFLRTVRFRQVVFASILAVAGGTGLALLAIPGSTQSFFSWGLAPPAVAALSGGLYVGSASAFGVGIATARRSGRGLCLMAIVFTLPTLIITLVHRDVFDFGRWQAWLWTLLFAGAPAFFVLLLALGAWRSVETGPRPAPWAAAAMAAIAVASAVGTILLWADPVGSGGWLPFQPPPLGGRFVGVWLAVIAVAAGWTAIRPRDEGRTTAFAVAALLGGALVGALRTYGQLEPGQGVGYVLVIAVALAASLGVLAAGGPARARSENR
jgi:hypothetical protein